MVVLVAVASSLATVGAIELLRGSPPGSRSSAALEPPPEPPAALAPRGVGPLVPAARAPDQPTDYEARLIELERRMSALELASTARRRPETSATGELPPQDELRELVLDWVAEEREARSRARGLEEEEGRRKELEFKARYQAHMLAQEHGLARWQEDEFAELFLETRVRAEEIEKSIDPRADDPEEVEARWAEFDEWVEQRERELTARLDPALYEKIYGED